MQILNIFQLLFSICNLHIHTQIYIAIAQLQIYKHNTVPQITDTNHLFDKMQTET